MMQSVGTKDIVRKVLCKHKPTVLALACTVACVVACSLLPPQILKVIIDKYLTQGIQSGLIAVALAYFGSFVLIGALDFIKGLLITVLGQKLVRAIRSEMLLKLTRIKATYLSDNAAGTIASHILNDVDNISTLFGDGVIGMLIDCLKVVGIVVSIWIFSPWLGIFALCLLPVIYGITTYFRTRLLSSQQDNLKQIAKVNNHIAESMKNILMLKSFNKEPYMEARYDKLLMDNYCTMNKVNIYDSCYSPIIQMLTAVATAILLLAFGMGSVAGLSIGMLTATINLITNLFAPIDNLGTELQSIQKGISGFAGADEFLSQAQDERQVVPMDVNAIIRDGADIGFEQLSFAYDNGKTIFDNINLHIAPGENICFVGRTGVGKTTLFRLVTGLQRPTGGRITLNGEDVFNIADGQKRQIFGYVEQCFSFVRGDITAQLRLGDDSITQQMIERAMALTGLHSYVLSLAHGYSTEADGGSMFSQGQRQLLSIARAIVTDPPILLLDEVTAGLDSVTEKSVIEVLKKAGSDKTILSITHRISSAKGSDRVVLLQNGGIAAIGTAEQLMDNLP